MGLRVRHIQTTTTTIDGTPAVVPVLDAEGREIELAAVEIPADIEAGDPTVLQAYADAALTSRETDPARLDAAVRAELVRRGVLAAPVPTVTAGADVLRDGVVYATPAAFPLTDEE